MSESTAKSVARGAFVLLLSNFIVKIIGICYKIPLTDMIGPRGMSYFHSAFEVQQILLTFSLSLPVAVSKLVAESASLGRGAEVRRIFRVTLITFSIIGILGTAILILGAPVFAAATVSVKAQYSIIALAPSLFLYAIAATFRGMYQGLGNMVPTAATQITEAVAKLLFGVLIADRCIKAGLADEFVAAGAISGTTIGIVFSVLILIPLYFLPISRRRMTAIPSGGESAPAGKLLRRLLGVAIPVTASSFIVNLTSFLDLFCISNRLQFIGMSEDAAATVYGGYKSYAQLLFNLPPSLIASIGLGILPAIAAAHVTGNAEKRSGIINSALRVTVLFAMPCAVGLAVLADPILHMLFTANPAEVSAAVPLMRTLGIASLFACIASVTTSCLQGINRLRLPLVSLAIGASVKLICNFILVGIPAIGIHGAPIGTNLCYITIIFINGSVLIRKAGLRLQMMQTVMKPLAAGAAMGIFCHFFYRATVGPLGSSVACLVTIFCAAFFYLAVLLLLRAFTEEDLALLPKGRRLAALLRRAKLLK